MKFDALVLVCSFLVAPLAWAGVDRAVVGAGTAKCATYLESVSKGFDPSLNVVASWTQGYLSAANIGRMNMRLPLLDLPDLEQIRAWHASYCKQHPNDLLYESTDSLLNSLQAR